MIELSSCKQAMNQCIDNKYFAVAHLYKEEKAMKMHIHNCYELYYSISGGHQFLIDNKFYNIAPGDIFAINQFESHHITQLDSEIHERIVISIHPDFLKTLSTEDTDLSECFRSRDNSFSHKLSLSKDEQQKFLYLVNKILSSNGYGHDIIERSAFSELILFLNLLYRKNQNIPVEIDSQSKFSKQACDILQYINKNIKSNITIHDIAEEFYISESYACRLFKNTTGTTINKYITARRINIAKSLLADGYSVQDCCIQSGYNDYGNFIKSFTREVGISPKKYALASLG